MCAPYSFEWMEYIEYYVVWFSPLYFRIWARLQNSVDSALSWYAPNRTFVALPLVVTNLDSSPLLKPPHRASMSKSLTSTLGLSPTGTQTIVLNHSGIATRWAGVCCPKPSTRLDAGARDGGVHYGRYGGDKAYMEVVLSCQSCSPLQYCFDVAIACSFLQLRS